VRKKVGSRKEDGWDEEERKVESGKKREIQALTLAV
jgi:hypothetical protein